MENLSTYFAIAGYIVTVTFVLIIIEFLYSYYYKKDEVHDLNDTFGNMVNSLIMKVFVADFGIAWYVGYLMIVKNYYPSFSIFSGYGIVSFIVCLMIVDLTFYWWHRWHHKIESLWALHFVHHSDVKVNLSTSYRLSFIEKITNIWTIAPAVLLGFDPYFVIFCFYCQSIFAFFSHSEYLKFPHFLNYIFITPHTHRIHHLAKFKEDSKNFALVFSFWDRMFGTYDETSNEKEYGIEGYYQSNFIKVQTDPLVAYTAKRYRQLRKFFSK